MRLDNRKATDIAQLIKKLIATHTTISTMESCTSGLIASMITDTEGASAIFPGGYVTYLNETKIFIGVDPKVLERYAVGITGTTGNLDLNNADSVQGRVFFCILIHDEANCFEVNADVTGMTRHEIKQMYAERVFDALDRLVFS